MGLKLGIKHQLCGVMWPLKEFTYQYVNTTDSFLFFFKGHTVLHLLLSAACHPAWPPNGPHLLTALVATLNLGHHWGPACLLFITATFPSELPADCKSVTLFSFMTTAFSSVNQITYILKKWKKSQHEDITKSTTEMIKVDHLFLWQCMEHIEK